MAGVNIEHRRDDHTRLLQTMVLDTYHRLQLQVYRLHVTRATKSPRGFGDLDHYPFPDDKDRTCYEALTDVFAKGGAKLVSRVEPTSTRAVEGIGLLDRIERVIYEQNDLVEEEAFIAAVLEANGPFHDLGSHMCAGIARQRGETHLGQLLAEGSLAFFERFFGVRQNAAPDETPEAVPSARVEEKVAALRAAMDAVTWSLQPPCVQEGCRQRWRRSPREDRIDICCEEETICTECF
jgi:hypothetical protein